MFSFSYFKQQPRQASRQQKIIRNPWTTKRHRPVVSPTVLGILMVALLLSLVAMAWLLLQAMSAATSTTTIPDITRTIPRPNNNINNNQPQLPPSPVLRPKQQQQPSLKHDNQPLLSLEKKTTTTTNSDGHDIIPMDTDQVGTERPTTIDAFRETFESRFGPTVAQLLRETALQSFGSLQATANRFLQARQQGRPFRLAFAGYSITVGRGNFYHQSYPFVLYHLLQPLLQHNLDLDLTVKNAAIGGIPSFPYGFCLNHFLGADNPDVVSWDYSMNEQGNTAVLEAYIRHAVAAYPHTRPLILALDKHKGRCDLLKDYTEKGLLQDALCVAKASEIIPKSTFGGGGGGKDATNAAEESKLPRGLQQWNEFGAPAKCPGRGSWHPKKMEHAAIAWSMASYFVDALELAIEQHHGGAAVVQQQVGGNNNNNRPMTTFPKPLSPSLPDNPPAIQSLLFGHDSGDATAADTNDAYRMHPVSCRTNFLPAADHENLLTTIVVSGLVTEATADTILETRSDEMYAQGWVLDVSQLERDTKIKVDKCGGLGYVDMKMALYGTADSGPLELWLPVDETGHEMHDHHEEEDQIESSTPALHWIQSLVVCEANEKRPEAACRLTDDIEYTVGGVSIPLPVPVLHGAGEYLKRPTCVALAIPEVAHLVQRDGAWGLPVKMQASSRVSRTGGACCLSHLIWEHSVHDE